MISQNSAMNRAGNLSELRALQQQTALAMRDTVRARVLRPFLAAGRKAAVGDVLTMAKPVALEMQLFGKVELIA